MLIFHQIFMENLLCVPNNMFEIQVIETLKYTVKGSYCTVILIINSSIVAWKDLSNQISFRLKSFKRL